MKDNWLFRNLNLGLRAEVIINISLLMLAAILLIGFTISKIVEKNMVQEKIRSSEATIRDVQATLDFLFRDKREFSLAQPSVQKELQDFVRIYGRGKGLDRLMIADPDLKVVVSTRTEQGERHYSSDLMARVIQTGQVHIEVDKSSGFLQTHYREIILYSPLWIQGKIVAGLHMEIPIGDVMIHVLESQRLILVSIILDAIVLIIFGSFLLSRVLVNPLKELIRLTQKIGAGDFSETIEARSRNEIGQLIASFNRMIEKLKENQESLENYLQSLEASNRKLKQAQEELIRTEKLASIGRFAAGVAHEVGNPLGAILGYTSILEKGGVDGEEAKDYLRRVEKEIGRIDRIVRELLDFARPSKFEWKDVQMNQVIQNSLSLISYEKSYRNIKTELNLMTNLPIIKGDESQISQVLINIILNAMDAMPEGGTLKITTDEHVVGDTYRDALGVPHARRRKEDPMESDYSHLRKPDPLSALFTKFSRGDRVVRVRISDTGIGIKKEDLERIFDPFFTTKAPDKGTGLGLSVSLRIVESMGGEIRVESEAGKGSAFDLYFPVAA